MTLISENKDRIGCFTSSEIVRLMGAGKRKMTEQELAERPKIGTGSKSTIVEDLNVLSDTALEYISEKNSEIRLQRSLDPETNSRATTWGKLGELYVVEQKLGIDYTINLDCTTGHAEYPFWKGTEDCTTSDTVGDIKCPYSLKSFCGLVDCVYVYGLIGIEAINHIRENHKDGEKYYWQLVSNSVLHNKKFAELIVFVPFKDELEEIKQFIDGDPRFINIFFANDSELPHLNKDGIYNNLTKIRFEVPESDKQLLEAKVKEAGKLLINQK